MPNTIQKNYSKHKTEGNARTYLAFGITFFAIVGITILGITIIIASGSDVNSRAQIVFNAVLPLFGTWVGTILAYYFAKENFEAGSLSAERLAQQLTPVNRLQTISVINAMVPKSTMIFQDDLTAKLVDILKELEDKKIKRLPVLEKNAVLNALVYRESIRAYLYEDKKASGDAERNDFTVDNLLTEKPESRRPVAFIGKGKNLADAKAEMEKNQDCRDVFVTNSGSNTEAILGLLTDVDISKHLNLDY